MQLKKLQQYISDYREILKEKREFHEIYKWECLKNFQDHWDIEAGDFAKMYDQSLQSTVTRRLWKGEDFFPKEMMLKFIAIAPDFVRAMFRDLFNEKKEVEDRVARFQFCCDSMLSEYKEANPLTIENNHFHQENHVISMYLTFRFPNAYTLFEYPVFLKAMKNLGTTKPPSPFDVTRFFKVTKTINTFLQKDEILLERHQKRLHPKTDYMDSTLLLVNDFYYFVAYS